MSGLRRKAVPAGEPSREALLRHWNSGSQGPLVVVQMGGSMANPIKGPDDQEQVPVLDDALRSSPQDLSEEVIPLVDETAVIGKQQVVTGRVRVRTVADTIEEIAHADLVREDVEVTRVPIDRVVDAPPQIRTDGDVTIVPVLEEVLVVEKRLVLKEELHIRRRIATETVEVPVTLRKQRAIVERDTPESLSSDEETTGRETENPVPR
jgi:uncharacterized protein (TIGR02271 family)